MSERAHTARGRPVPAWPEFTFPDSGITVRIRRLGPFTLDDIRRQAVRENPRPQPQLVPVEVGETPAGEPIRRLEPNPADPNYQRALTEWETRLQEMVAERFLEVMLRYAVVLKEPLTDDDRREAQVFREVLKLSGVSDEEVAQMSDEYLYIRNVCVSSARDLEQLQSFVMGRSQPTEEAVQAHIDSFRRDV